jgi:hypothetical protein
MRPMISDNLQTDEAPAGPIEEGVSPWEKYALLGSPTPGQAASHPASPATDARGTAGTLAVPPGVFHQIRQMLRRCS